MNREDLYQTLDALPRGGRPYTAEMLRAEADQLAMMVTLLGAFDVPRAKPSWDRNFEKEILAYGKAMHELVKAIGGLSKTAVSLLERHTDGAVHPVKMRIDLEKALRGLGVVEMAAKGHPSDPKGRKRDDRGRIVVERLVGIYENVTGDRAAIFSEQVEVNEHQKGARDAGPFVEFAKAACLALGLADVSPASQLRALRGMSN